MDETRLGGVILAGGRGSRLGGADKPMLDVGGEPVLARAVRALAGAEFVLTGSPRRGFEHLRWTVEDPPGGGPTAALAAGLAVLGADPDPIALLAGDLVGVTAATVRRLCAAIAGVDGAVLTDASGHRQWALSVWRADTLRSALPDAPAGVPLRTVLGALRVTEVAELPGESADVDTPADLDRVRAADRVAGPSQGSYRLPD